MAPRRKAKKGTLHYALELCDRGQLTTIISGREDLDGKASMEVMNIIRRSREFSRVNISPLQGAVSLGHYNICKQLVEEGAVLRSPSNIPHPLCLALQKHHYEIAHLLIEAGADVKLSSGDSLPLCYALENTDCNIPIVRNIIDAGFPVNGIVHRPSQRTALHVAVRMDNMPVVLYLLSILADPNVKDQRGLSPLHYAVQKNLPDMVRLLCENGATIDIECEEYFTPMSYAIAMGNYDMVNLLISLGSDIHYINGSKKCPLMPLHFAASIFKLRIVQFLIEKGANVNKVVPKTGETPLHCAARGDTQNNHQNKIALDCIVELLIKHNADLKVRHSYGLTPVQVAIKARNLSVAKILVINGSELNNFLQQNDDKGYTTFHIAAKCLDKELIQICFDYGADCNARDDDGLSPLHLALLSAMLDIFTRKTDCGFSLACNEQLEIFKIFWKQGFPFDLSLKMRWLHYETPPIPVQISSLVQKQKMLFKALKGLDPTVVGKAICQGAYANCCSTDIPFPIHFIASKGNYEILKLFLANHVNTNILDQKGESALFIAAKGGHFKCCRLLLENGACYNYCSSKCPKTPVEVAKENGHSEIVTLLTKIEKCFKDIKKPCFRKLTIDLKILHAAINCCDRSGLTLLGKAVNLGMKPSAESLIKLRCQISGFNPVEKENDLKTSTRLKKL